MSYSFAYNNGSSPSGTTKFAKLQIGGNNREYTTYGNLNWYASAPYNGKFLIVSDTYSQGWTTEGNATPTFWRSANNTLDSLKDLVNQLPDVNGVTGFTDVSGAINYINSSEKYLISQESDSYPEGEIVTSGLVLNLDAGYSNSYPKSGTTWYDIKGTNNGTLINGPTFDSGNGGGSLILDGVDDRIGIGSLSNNGTPYTLIFAFKSYVGTGSNDGYRLIGATGGPTSQLSYSFDNGNLRIWPPNKWQTFDSSVSANNVYIVAQSSSTNTTRVFVNGAFKTQYNISPIYFNNLGFGQPYTFCCGSYFDGELYFIQYYNRALSDSEVLQNFNAQKGRFGL